MDKGKVIPAVLVVLVLLVCAGLLSYVFVVYFKECTEEDKIEEPICRHDQDIQFVKMPADKLMTMSDFDSNVVGQEMSRMYCILTEPLAFIPSANFFVTISKVGQSSMASYNRTAIGDDVSKNACYRSAWTYTPTEQQERALFKYQVRNKEHVAAYFSSCPSKYYWSTSCSDYSEDKLEHFECPLNKTLLILFVRGDLNDISLFDMVKDLHETAGVKFGVANFRWFFTFGNSTTLC